MSHRATLPSVSVIVPVYNGAATIEDCLASLLSLDYPGERLEIVAVDNGSTDGTPEILGRFEEGELGAAEPGEKSVRGPEERSGREPRRVVVSTPVRGPSAARNRGIAEAGGAVLAFTDADCVVDPGWLAALVEPLSDPEVGVAAGRILARRPATPIQRFSEFLDDHARATGGRIPSAITMNWASPASLIRALGGFDEAMIRAEDSDLAFRIFLAGPAFRYVEDAVVYHLNPSHLQELMAEGYQHGMSSVVLDKKHDEARRALGVRRVDVWAYRDLVRTALRTMTGGGEVEDLCALAFGVGKKAGRVAGSLRFGHLYL